MVKDGSVMGVKSAEQNYTAGYKRLVDKVSSLFDFIFPLRCVGCGELIGDNGIERDEPFCETCKESIEYRGENFCPICGIRHQGMTGESKCAECIKSPRPNERLIYHYVYGGVISDAITSFKYHHNLFAGRVLISESLQLLSSEILRFSPEIILPVPLHFIKYFMRGFSPTAYIASFISRALNIPVCFNILKKVKYTRPQVTLSREERLRNLRGSIVLNKSKLYAVKDRRVLLVDDVYTTGATTSICSELLIRAGASSIIIFVLARGE